MRKLVVSMNVSLDGYMSGPNCELDWHFKSWTKEMGIVLCEQLSQADTILLGRITYTGMAKYWQGRYEDPGCSAEDFAFASMMNSYSKVVVSKTISTAQWGNTTLVKRNIVGAVGKLKQQPGKDIIIYGSGKLVASLIELVDEFRLWLHPVVLGSGKPLFREVFQQLNLRLISTERFNTGVVVLVYRRLQ
jgi:dihydrofolate reductase